VVIVTMERVRDMHADGPPPQTLVDVRISARLRLFAPCRHLSFT